MPNFKGPNKLNFFLLFSRTNSMASQNESPFRERSAEATALQLLMNLKNPHQLKASELRFLVSEKEAPQEV